MSRICLDQLTAGHLRHHADVCVDDGTGPVLVRRDRKLLPFVHPLAEAPLRPEDLIILVPHDTEDPVGTVREAIEALGFRAD